MTSFANYLNLTKPRIVVLFAVTGFVAIVVEGHLLAAPMHVLLVCLGMMLTAASANAFNMFIDRDIDSIMDRTRLKRVIPLGILTAKDAIYVGLVAGAVAFAMLYATFNLLTAALSLFTILFYALVYTKWLKRTTPWNTFLGGVAGAMAPLIGSAAATGSISPFAWSLFAIIMVWSPPHFYALAITLKDDYAKAGIPMVPVKFGKEYTRRSILRYTIALLPVALLPYLIGSTSLFYAFGITAIGGVYLAATIVLQRRKTDASSKMLFYVSLLYITWLFLFLLMDATFFQ